MKQILNYNIHDLLTFQIVRNKRKDLIKDLNLEFSFFEVERVDEPDIILNIGKFTPSNEDCYVVDHKYHIKNNYLYCMDSDRRTRWEVEIFGFEGGKTIINFDGTVFGLQNILIPDFLPQNLLLRPLIDYKLFGKNCFSIHSAAVSKDNHAYMLAGRAGAFKTTLTMDFIRKKEFDLMGDDRIIIHENKVLAYPLHLKTFNFKSAYLPTENFRGFLDKIRFVKYLRNNQSYMNFDMPITESATFKALFFLVKTNKQGLLKKTIMNSKKAASKIAQNNKMEMVISPRVMHLSFGRLYNYMLAYSFIFPDSKIATYWSDLERKLGGVLDNIPIYEIEIPNRYNLNTFNKIYDYIREQ